MVSEADLKILQWIRQNVPSYISKKVDEAKKPLEEHVEFSKKEISTAVGNLNSLFKNQTELSNSKIQELVEQSRTLFSEIKGQSELDRAETHRAIQYLLSLELPKAEPGKKGDDGKDGVGIKKIHYVDGNPMKIIFTLTDNTEHPITLPKLEVSARNLGGGGGSSSRNAGLPNVRVVSTDTLVKEYDDIIVVTATATITLPVMSKKTFRIKRFGENITVTVVAAGGKTIDGLTSRLFNVDLWSEDYFYVKSSDSWVVL